MACSITTTSTSPRWTSGAAGTGAGGADGGSIGRGILVGVHIVCGVVNKGMG